MRKLKKIIKIIVKVEKNLNQGKIKEKTVNIKFHKMMKNKLNSNMSKPNIQKIKILKKKDNMKKHHY